MRKQLARLFTLAIPLVAISCATAKNSAQSGGNQNDSVPSWVRTTKIYDDKICALGSCEQTFFQEQGKPCAADSARESLAKSVSVHVASIMLDENVGGRQSVDSAGVSSVSETISETVLKEAVISDYWLDSEGKIAKGFTYAQACIPKSKLKAK
ncbi:MAG: hypothetical protein HY280_09940 [Nitrospinae bacterium]|nr:hypothetical protein [Nitrospinota bacterium]